jgi:hypothetical protein
MYGRKSIEIKLPTSLVMAVDRNGDKVELGSLVDVIAAAFVRGPRHFACV